MISPFVVKVNTNAKQQKITTLMDRIFSSESDGETTETGRNPARRQDRDAPSETSSVTIEDPSAIQRIKSENDCDEDSVEIVDSEEEIVVKTESSVSERPSEAFDISDPKGVYFSKSSLTLRHPRFRVPSHALR